MTALAFADEAMRRSAVDANMILFIDFTLSSVSTRWASGGSFAGW
jgi:hypothetical protein